MLRCVVVYCRKTPNDKVVAHCKIDGKYGDLLADREFQPGESAVIRIEWNVIGGRLMPSASVVHEEAVK